MAAAIPSRCPSRISARSSLREGAHQLQLEDRQRFRLATGMEWQPLLQEADRDAVICESGDELIQVHNGPGPLLPVTVLLMEVGDFPMMRRMLRGIAERATRAFPRHVLRLSTAKVHFRAEG